MERSSGILMPMFSLPSPYGIGTMGKSAYEFVDFLKASGQKYWQLLPLGPTSEGDSPYSSFSTFAGNPYYIDLDFLIKDGFLKKSDVENIDWGTDETHVDYEKIYNNRFLVLRKAFYNAKDVLTEKISAFRHENKNWIENYALYMSVKSKFNMKSWLCWEDDDIRLFKPEAVEKYKSELSEEIDFYVFIQYLFYSQWESLHSYAHENGIKFIGDVPIYVALDSADVWSESRFFRLDEDKKPKNVAGVPPDAFSKKGQLWGNPLYDYSEMKNDGFGWWIRRIDGAKKLYDVIRIDHFRGFESYWAVPYGEKTAENGTWEKGPEMSLVGVLSGWFHGLEFIAEDLGIITDDVKILVKNSGFPGMKVLLFAFDAKTPSSYLPHKCNENSVCYIGTHDNETVSGWLSTSKKCDIENAKKYMNISEEEGWNWGFIRTGMQTASKLFVMGMQDILCLPPETRTNTPGTKIGNWQWRMKKENLTKSLSEKLKEYTNRYGRI